MFESTRGRSQNIFDRNHFSTAQQTNWRLCIFNICHTHHWPLGYFTASENVINSTGHYAVGRHIFDISTSGYEGAPFFVDSIAGWVRRWPYLLDGLFGVTS